MYIQLYMSKLSIKVIFKIQKGDWRFLYRSELKSNFVKERVDLSEGNDILSQQEAEKKVLEKSLRSSM